MTQFCKTIGLILVAAGFLPAFGRTVAWYRLDGFAPGEKTTADTVIENIADPGHLQGKCYTCTTANTTYGTDANGMPYGMPGLNGAFGVLDPVTGEWSARTNTMHFGLEKGTDYKQVSGNWVADGSTVKVTTDSRLALSNITVEVIFRAVSDFPGATWNFAPLAMLNGRGQSNEGWTLGFGWNGKIAARWSPASGETSSMQSSDVKTFGAWHHAAFTLDAEGNAKLYYDYELANRLGGTSLQPYQNDTLTIASHPSRAGRTFPGEILDVRISDTALAPDQFLRLTAEPRETTPETVVYIPFGGVPATDFGTLLNVSACTNGDTRASFVFDEGVDTPIFDKVDKPCAANRFGLADSALVDNAVSYHMETNGLRKSMGLRTKGNQPDLFGNAFTFECNFKTQGQIVPSSVSGLTGDCSWTIYRSDQLQMFVDPADGCLVARIFAKGGGWSDIKSAVRVDDSQWHHVAVVWDYNPMQRLYLDGALVGRQWVTPKTGESNVHLGINNNSAERRCFSGWLDEIRFTRKPLKQVEFLTAEAVQSGEPQLLAYAPFDGDYAVLPYTTLTPAGSGVARTNGVGNLMEPVFTSYCYGNILWDGLNGKDERENKGSVYMEGSQIRLPNVPTMKNNGPYTVEWFMRLTWAENGVGLLRLNRTTANYEGSSPAGEWMLYSAGDAPQIQAYIAGGQKYMGSFGRRFPSAMTDSKWHHYALTVSEVEVVTGEVATATATRARFELWRDYESYGAITNKDGRLTVDTVAEDFSFTIGANNNFKGWVDELRVSAGVLPPEKFMRKAKKGLMVIVR